MTLKIEYHPRLVEQTVRHAVHADPKLEADLHRQTDPLYDDPPSSERERKFIHAYADFFERLNLDRGLRQLLAERPVIKASVRACIVGPVLRAAQEGAELLVASTDREATRDGRVLMLQVSPPTLAEPELFGRRMRPELVHIADMVDPAFRYRRQQIEGLPARRNLIRDRYRVLWDVYVHGRLEREGHGDPTRRPKLLALLARVFAIESDEVAGRAFARVFHAPSLTHEQLFTWACAPHEFSGPDSVAPEARLASPGAECPLCGFSTFDWFNFDGGAHDDFVREIQRRRPAWTRTHGACRQCAEIYGSLTAARG